MDGDFSAHEEGCADVNMGEVEIGGQGLEMEGAHGRMNKTKTTLTVVADRLAGMACAPGELLDVEMESDGEGEFFLSRCAVPRDVHDRCV